MISSGEIPLIRDNVPQVDTLMKTRTLARSLFAAIFVATSLIAPSASVYADPVAGALAAAPEIKCPPEGLISDGMPSGSGSVSGGAALTAAQDARNQANVDAFFAYQVVSNAILRASTALGTPDQASTQAALDAANATFEAATLRFEAAERALTAALAAASSGVNETTVAQTKIGCNAETAAHLPMTSANVDAWNCGNGLNPFISPRDPSNPPDYPANPDTIWIEGYGYSGALGTGSRTYVEEATRRVYSTFKGFSNYNSGYTIHPEAFAWAGNSESDVAPPDLVAAYIGISAPSKIDFRSLSDRVADFARAAYTSVGQVPKAGKFVGIPGYNYRDGGGPVPARVVVSPLNATHVDYSYRGWPTGAPLNDGTFKDWMNTGLTAGWSVSEWINHLSPGTNMNAYAPELSASPARLPIDAQGIWTTDVYRWVPPSSAYILFPLNADGTTPSPAGYTEYYPGYTVFVRTDRHVGESVYVNGVSHVWYTGSPSKSQLEVDSAIEVAFTVRVPNRPHDFQTISGGDTPSVQGTLKAIITEQMKAKKGTLYYLPTFLGPMDPSADSTCGSDIATIYGGHINPDNGPATCAVAKLNNIDAWRANFGSAGRDTTGGCFIGWSSFRIPFPKLPTDVFATLTGMMSPRVELSAAVPQPIIGQPLKLKLASKILPPAAVNHDASVTTGGSVAELHVTINQVGVTLSVGALGGDLGIFRVADGSGGWKPASVIAIPRDPAGGIGGGYERLQDLTITFNRTPLSVLQDQACQKFATSPSLLEARCGIRVEKGDLAFVLQVSTWWDSIYSWNSSGYRGTFNPRWAEIADNFCTRIEPWHPTYGFDAVPYGRFPGMPLYKAPGAKGQDWNFAVAQIRYGLHTPYGDNTRGLANDTCMASSYGQIYGNQNPHGSPMFQNLPQTILISPRQVQVTGGGTY